MGPGSDADGQGAHKPHTLEEYALDHFRPPTKRTMSRALTLTSARRAGKDELWRHSREPIRQPLLKKLLTKEELALEVSPATPPVSLSN
jgi:myosin-7